MLPWLTRATLIVCAAQLLAASCASGQHVNDATVRWIDAVRTQLDIPGLAVVIVANPLYMKAKKPDTWEWGTQILTFGNATAKTAVDRNTLFPIASNSKTFTALAVGQQIFNRTIISSTNKSIVLDTKIKDVIPEWGLEDDYASTHATVKDLLSMNSGLPGHGLALRDEPVSATMARMRLLRMSSEIRGGFQYNNMHYAVAAELVARVSGKPFVDHMNKGMLAYLNMSATYNRTAARTSGRWSDAHVSMGFNATACAGVAAGGGKETKIPRACLGQVHALRWDEDSDGLNTAGYGGLSASADDMAKFLKTLVVSPAINEFGRLQDELVNFTSRPRVVSSIGSGYEELGPSMYGMGAVVQDYRGHTTVFHDGGAPGHSSLIARVPSAGVGVAILANHGPYGTMANPYIWYKLVDTLLDLSPIEWDKRLVESVRNYYGPAGLVLYDPDRPVSKPPSVPWDDIPGTYSDPGGYGDIRLERDDGSLLTAQERQIVKSAGGVVNGPVFVADLDAAQANRIVLTHMEAITVDVFQATILYIAPEVYGNGSVVSLLGAAPVVITPIGIGAFGPWWRGGPEVVNPEPPVVGGVEEVQKTAEVWFAKV